MRYNKQLIVSPTHGDCFRACMTSILDIPNDPALPGAGDPEWFSKWWNFLRDFGLQFHYELKACWRYGYWIASVKSLNFENGTHAIVMHHDLVEFDPSTAKGYVKGESLLKGDAVKGGYYLEVVDSSKLVNLVELQRLSKDA